MKLKAAYLRILLIMALAYGSHLSAQTCSGSASLNISIGCTPNLTISGSPISGGAYKSTGDLTALDVVLPPGRAASFISDTGILLSPGFSVELGADLEAFIEPCVVGNLEDGTVKKNKKSLKKDLD